MPVTIDQIRQAETISRSVVATPCLHSRTLSLEIEKTLAEGAAAACLAAVLTHRGRFLGKRVGLVLSGGNIDPLMLAGIIERGMVRTGRLTRLIVEMRDLPSALAEVTGCLAELNAKPRSAMLWWKMFCSS